MVVDSGEANSLTNMLTVKGLSGYFETRWGFVSLCLERVVLEFIYINLCKRKARIVMTTESDSNYSHSVQN